MRSLALDEVERVSGGGPMQDITEATAFGAAAGSSIGFIITNTVLGATRGGLLGGAIMFSWSSGYAIGTKLYDMLC